MPLVLDWFLGCRSLRNCLPADEIQGGQCSKESAGMLQESDRLASKCVPATGRHVLGLKGYVGMEKQKSMGVIRPRQWDLPGMFMAYVKWHLHRHYLGRQLLWEVIWVNYAHFHCKCPKELCWFGILGESLINEYKAVPVQLPGLQEQRYFAPGSPVKQACTLCWSFGAGGVTATSEQLRSPENLQRSMPDFLSSPQSPAIGFSPLPS